VDLKDTIRTIPDYPKPGIQFRDVTTLMGNPRAFRQAVDELVQPFAGAKIDKVAGIEARGFILGGAVAHQLSAGFVPLRKKGKLPHAVITESYELEYGADAMEMHQDALILRSRLSNFCGRPAPRLSGPPFSSVCRSSMATAGSPGWGSK
jgi:adenine phosphoribosyltransferase